MGVHVVLPRSRSSCRTAVVVACALTSLTVIAAEPHKTRSCYLQDGDRVVFYGDSITEQGYYTRAIEDFVLTRVPEIKVTFSNRGWAGDCAWGGGGGTLEERLTRDVIPLQPTVVVVMFGMNDAYYMHHDPANVAAFKSNLEKLIDTLRQRLPNVRITLLGTSPYDDLTPGDRPEWEQTIPGGYGAVVAHYSRAAEEVAVNRQMSYVDMHEPIRNVLRLAGEKHPELVAQLIPDRIHPGPAVGLIMAARLLAAWNMSHDQTAVEFQSLEKIDGRSRECTAMRLPLPIRRADPLTRLAVEYSPELNLLAGNLVRVTDFPGNFATLFVDGENIGTLSARQLAEGVDLSRFDTPLDHAAENVARLTHLRGELQFTRWRCLERQFLGKMPPTLEPAMAALADLEQQTIMLQRSAAQPSSHRLTLILADQ